jgi:dolichol-phosphate mannosyltransferase
MEKKSGENFIFYKVENMKHIILIPTYNESENIENIISTIFSMYPNLYIKIIDDNSPDGTGNLVKSMMIRCPNLSILERKNKEGLGKAYIAGFNEIFKDNNLTHVITMDADMSHDPIYLKEMIKMSKDYDLVIGSRYVKGGDTIGWEFWRRMLSKFGNIYAGIITGTFMKDLTGGFNCMNLDFLRKINVDSIDSSGYAYQIEMKYMFYKNGAKVKEVPIIFKNRIGGESKISNHIISEGIIAPWKMRMKK